MEGRAFHNHAGRIGMEGYKHGAPNRTVEEIDRPIAEAMVCKKCQSKMQYEAYHRTGSYIALAICPKCGREVEF